MIFIDRSYLRNVPKGGRMIPFLLDFISINYLNNLLFVVYFFNDLGAFEIARTRTQKNIKTIQQIAFSIFFNIIFRHQKYRLFVNRKVFYLISNLLKFLTRMFRNIFIIKEYERIYKRKIEQSFST